MRPGQGWGGLVPARRLQVLHTHQIEQPLRTDWGDDSGWFGEISNAIYHVINKTTCHAFLTCICSAHPGEAVVKEHAFEEPQASPVQGIRGVLEGAEQVKVSRRQHLNEA